jgi:hypothetical protein
MGGLDKYAVVAAFEVDDLDTVVLAEAAKPASPQSTRLRPLLDGYHTSDAYLCARIAFLCP